MEEILVNGMTWCQTCFAPMQLVSCPHHKYFVVDPRDVIPETIPTIDGREKLLHEMYHCLMLLVHSIIWADENDEPVIESDDFKWAEKMLELYWEWDPMMAIQVMPETIIRKQNYRRQVPK